MSFSKVIRNQRSFGNVVVPIESADALNTQVKSVSVSSGDTADSQLSRAREEANKILEQARSAADDIKRRAFDEGYAAGKEQGLHDAALECQTKVDDAVRNAEEVLTAAKTQQSTLIGSMGDVLTELVMTAVDSILHKEGTTAHADVAALVADLLEQEVRSAEVEVRVHPADYPNVVSHCQEHCERPNLKVMVTPDKAVTRGGCIVVTGTEEIDASIETTLELLVPTVKRAVGRLLDERTVGVLSGV